MSHAVTEKLEPQAFFYWFEQIAQIPHGSGKEQKLAAFLEEYAHARGISVETDGLGNVLMRLPAAEGYGQEPPVLFQAHMDMVWAKDPEVDFDFETQPLRLAVSGDHLHAQSTTLGADNAVGMATMLALGDARDIPHPPLEFLFTVQEETGMHGIRGFDMKKLRARRMINMDCGDSHVLGVSSGGRLCVRAEKTCTAAPPSQDTVGLSVYIHGGTGGHGGLDIHRGRCCAANAMGILLAALEDIPVALSRLEGTSPIMKACSAVLAVPEKYAQRAAELLRERFGLLQEKHRQTDPALGLTVETVPAPETAVEPGITQGIIQLLQTLSSQVYYTDPRDPAIIVTSGVWSSLHLEGGKLALSYSYRSSSEALSQQLFQAHSRLAAQYGLELKQADGYPGWQERARSPFRDQFLRHHEALFGQPMALERVSGGIEVGIITAAIADMDAVGIAPTSRGAHTPTEHLLISQVADYWTLLKAVLADKETN